MNTRIFGRSGRAVGEVGLGTWQIGGNWGDVAEADATATLQAAYDGGVTVFDTADVYGDGLSEERVGRFLQDTPGAREQVFVATKLGRRGDPGWPENFTRAAVRQHTEDSLRRLQLEALDLTQLHCLPPEELSKGDIFSWLDELVTEGKLKAYGASVESMGEALTCIEDGRCTSLQIIFNALRQKPIDTLFTKAQAAKVALIVRLPLASGLLGGKMSAATTFAADDHRNFNRDGQAFNVGETFSGLTFAKGLEVVEAIRPLVPAGMSMAEMALRWCLDHEAVSVLIPGARNPAQVATNISASAAPALSPELHEKLREIYQGQVTEHIRGLY
ncbi:aldo/keto reductase [Opitutaceae bacterium]|nr:aldo/keto reductase [Opitutaceae bacterium]